MRALNVFLASTVFVVVVLFSVLYHYSPMLKPFPKPTGPYAVGTVSYHLVDSNRVEKHNKNKPR